MTSVPKTRRARDRGFALVVTLSLMILLTVIAVGLLSLSAISLRGASQGSAQAEAKANARLALMLAIGELQKHAGQDTVVTAPADILDEDNPPLTGVWRSWEGSDHNESGHSLAGRPRPPDYGSKVVSSAVDEDGRFLSWLVSGGDDASLPEDAASLVRRVSSEDTIPLVSSGSLAADDDREVHVTPVTVDEGGAYAWWVSGENQKACLPRVNRPQDESSIFAWSKFGSTFQSTDPKPFGLDNVFTDTGLAADLEKVYTRGSIGLLPSAMPTAPPEKAFHDFSAFSVGLLTNVATGGWRKDLSLLTERWDEQNDEGLELFQLEPGVHQSFTRPENVSYSGVIPEAIKKPGSVFYPWSDYRTHPGGNNWPKEVWHNNAAVASWAALADYSTFYRKNLAGSLSDTSKVAPQSWNFVGSPDTYFGLHGTHAIPHIARFQLIYSYYARQPKKPDPNDPNALEPAVLITPVVTLWNPYNYEIQFGANENFRARLTRALPVALKFSNPQLGNEFWAVQSSNSSNSPYKSSGREMVGNFSLRMVFNANELVPNGNPALTLGPGETRVFSPVQDVVLNNNGNSGIIKMKPGLLHGGRYLGYVVPLAKMLPDGITALSPSTSLQADARFDQNGLGNCGVRYQWGRNNSEQHGTVWAGYSPEQADLYYAPPNDLPESISLEDCLDDAEPFLSLVFGSRIAAVPLVKTGLDGKLTQVNRQSKGMAQASPAIKSANYLTDTWSDDYPGLNSLINSPWDFTYFYHSGDNDTYLPEANNNTAGGYIVTGLGASNGLSRLVMYDLPTRPLSSLGQLSSWFIRGLNSVPPQAHDLIGNSDATPLIASDDVVHPLNNNKNSRINLQQDDSYCANHLLFDDWFFSSIAPDLANNRDLEENYIDFLTGADPLTNFVYRPIAEDRATKESEVQDTYDSHVQPAESWKTVASRLQVEGMFNVNSTSVRAWRALLGHARNHRIPYMDTDGSVDLSDEVDYALPRTEIASTNLTGEGSGNGNFELTAEFAGARVFTEEMLDQLAINIVEQVRSRGPFLSLSEFVNRQLSNNTNLALGGAIQVALNNLSNSSDNPFDTLESTSKPSVDNPDGNPEYAFPEAAVGYNAYGLPGWPRQADVLRPIAPVLSARDDSFTIRAYGDSRDAQGNIVARAWCEAVVQRTREYCDSADEADITTQPKIPSNQIFGRKFILKSFRWLNASEI